jgi:hypothetical protein
LNRRTYRTYDSFNVQLALISDDYGDLTAAGAMAEDR